MGCHDADGHWRGPNQYEVLYQDNKIVDATDPNMFAWQGMKLPEMHLMKEAYDTRAKEFT